MICREFVVDLWVATLSNDLQSRIFPIEKWDVYIF